MPHRLRLPPWIPLAFCVYLCCPLSSPAFAQISVHGVSDRTVYADTVSFVVDERADYETTAQIDGAPVAVGVPVTVDDVDYHELVVRSVHQTSGEEETLLIQFIVRSSERGNSERGLPAWVPYPMIPSAAAEFAGARLRIVTPREYPQGLEIPVVAWVLDADGKRSGVNGVVTASEHPGHSVELLRGVGSGYLAPRAAPGVVSYTASIGPLETPVEITVQSSTSWRAVEGPLGPSTDWGEDSRVDITGTVTVPSGTSLTVGAGSVVRVAPDADIVVNGKLVVNGTLERPVVFTPASREAPWGGFLVRGSAAALDITGAIATGGCADPEWFDNNPGSGSTHLRQQALLYVGDGAHATLTDSCLLDSRGQAGHGESSYLTWTRSLIQRFLTGGEYNGCIMTLDDCALIEFPSASAPFADDDGDAIYFTGGSTIPSSYSVTGTLIGWAHDDGIDSGSGDGGVVKVYDCWIESCFHEGLAWSSDAGARDADVQDTVTINCGQGIESGWGDARVVAERCLSTGNLIGARFGDNYDWTYSGFLRVVDSLLLYNYRDVWGRAWDDWSYHVSQMDIRENLLTLADPRFPENSDWDPGTDASRLEPFLSVPAGPVGIGIATAEDRIDLSRLSDGIPLRLSSFSVLPVAVDYDLDSELGPLRSGTLHWEPGETVKKITPDAALLEDRQLVRLTLKNPQNGEITGRDDVEYVRFVETTLIQRGSAWKYLDSGVDQGAAWRERGFDDAGWPLGEAELGFGDGGEATTINGGPSGNRFPTVYFRTTFEVADPASFERLLFQLLRDDGAVVYLNGRELFRSNMPAGEVTYATWASSSVSGSAESSVIPWETDASLLVAGANTLAVEVHQSGASSSDVSFDLELNGVSAAVSEQGFVRGDANGDRGLDLSDAITVLVYLFSGGVTTCEDALDVNDSGEVNITDVVFLLDYLFQGSAPPPTPFPRSGEDPTPDGLGCPRAGPG